MELNQIDLLILNETSTSQKEITEEQEGSLLTIEQPQEKNSYEILKTELEIEKEDNTKKLIPRIPFGFFSHVQQNRTKYLY